MNTAVAERTVNPVAEIRHQLDGMTDQFKSALPAHMPVERFTRVVMTAVQNNPDLINKVDRRSLWNAAMRAAQDGLLPDGREGAIVVFGTAAQWMPMVGGLRKKVRNSGEIATWEVNVVHENDAFDYALGDEPFIHHKPTLDEPGKVIAAYSVATLKSGEKSRELMSVAQIEKVRSVSRAKAKGPWVDWYEEMCRKTVARRHAKSLPMSSDLDDLIRRDDDLYDFEGARQEAQQDRPKSLAGRLDALARLPSAAPAKPNDALPAAEIEDITDNGSVTQQEEHGASNATVAGSTPAGPTTTEPAAASSPAAPATPPVTAGLSRDDLPKVAALHDLLKPLPVNDFKNARDVAGTFMVRQKPEGALKKALDEVFAVHSRRMAGEIDEAECNRRVERIVADATHQDMLG